MSTSADIVTPEAAEFLTLMLEETERLESHHYLRIKKVETKGRPSIVCTVNPKVLG